jgi:hypothetical protein
MFSAGIGTTSTLSSAEKLKELKIGESLKV